MSPRFDQIDVIASLAGVIDTINAGAAPVPALTGLLTIAQDSLGAAGLAFVEQGPLGGRVIAATGAMEWALGGPVDLTHPILVALQSGPRTQDVPVDRLPTNVIDLVSARGLTRILYCRASLGALMIGHLVAFFPDAGGRCTPEQHALIHLVAACAAQVYGGSTPPAVEGNTPDRDLLIAVTSHELRTPVTVIKGYADTLTDHWESLDEFDRREALRVISQRSTELARLVDRLLSAAVDTGAVGVQHSMPFDLVEGLQVAIRELPRRLYRRLDADLRVDLPKALGDRASLATVLTELVTNADKYTDDNSLRLELSVGSDERSVFFRVSDRGIGVRPEDVERAFDRFWQGDSENGSRYRGTGLGLYLVRRIVERQNGWVSLRPREGGGTVAEVRLPRGDLTVSVEA